MRAIDWLIDPLNCSSWARLHLGSIKHSSIFGPRQRWWQRLIRKHLSMLSQSPRVNASVLWELLDFYFFFFLFSNLLNVKVPHRCRECSQTKHRAALAFHGLYVVTTEQVKILMKVTWGNQGDNSFQPSCTVATMHMPHLHKHTCLCPLASLFLLRQERSTWTLFQRVNCIGYTLENEKIKEVEHTLASLWPRANLLALQ